MRAGGRRNGVRSRGGAGRLELQRGEAGCAPASDRKRATQEWCARPSENRTSERGRVQIRAARTRALRLVVLRFGRRAAPRHATYRGTVARAWLVQTIRAESQVWPS